MGLRANSSSRLEERPNSFSKLESGLLSIKTPNLSLEELRKKIEHLLELNI